MTRRRRRRGLPEPVDAPTFLRLIDQAVDELHENITAQERIIFVNLRQAVLSGAGVPREHMGLSRHECGSFSAIVGALVW